MAGLEIVGVGRWVKAEPEGKVLACLGVFAGQERGEAGRAVLIAEIGQCLQRCLAFLCRHSAPEIFHGGVLETRAGAVPGHGGTDFLCIGFIETEHFGIRFPARASHIDLTAISQRWLRDLLWDYTADLISSPRRPRTAAPIDGIRRACTELSAFLEVDATSGGHDPSALGWST